MFDNRGNSQLFEYFSRIQPFSFKGFYNNDRSIDSHEPKIQNLIGEGDIGLALRRKNKVVIESLPTDDLQWPWIDRGMFLVQDPENPKMYRDQVIVFGASYKEVEMEWEAWLKKFESILKQLYWMTATIHPETELVGKFTYGWGYDPSLLDTWATDDPMPTSLWSFSGGPREFY